MLTTFGTSPACIKTVANHNGSIVVQIHRDGQAKLHFMKLNDFLDTLNLLSETMEFDQALSLILKEATR